MKKILLILTFVFSLIRLEAQVSCPNDNSFWLDLTPSGVGNTKTSFCTYAGDYDTFTACNGTQYGISVCGGSYNSAVTMYSNTGTLLYSQNAVSGNGCETFTWTSTISGVVRVLVDIASCGTNSVCTQVSITQLTSCGTSTPSGNQDCSNSILVCNDVSFSGNSSGFGTQELPNNGTIDGCLTLEHQSSWYTFQIATSGTISLNITTTYDYDFAIWGPNVNCSSLGSPIRCSYSGLAGNTGLGNGATDLSDGDGTGSNGGLDAWVKPLNVVAGQTYIMLIDNFTANSTPFTLDWTMSGGASLNCGALPIELLYFNANQLNCNENLLIWSTATEINSDYFDVERSFDAIHFEFIGRIKAAGNSTSIVNYDFKDSKPYQGLNYYRLKQVDYNGDNEVFTIVSVDNSCSNNLKVVKMVNLIGQEVGDGYEGVKFIFYNDGSVVRKLK